METYLHKLLKDYFREITIVEGFLLSVEGFIKYSENKLSELYKDTDTDSINSLISCYRDLSAISKGDNLYFTGFKYELKISDFEKDLAIIVSRECCLTLSQVYEIFESFLKNILAVFLLNNPKFLEIININDTVRPSDINEYIELINTIQRQGKNNKRLLWCIRKISSFYKKHELDNIWRFNMANWYDLISEIRHAIIHNRQDLTYRVKEVINKNNNSAIYERYFIQDKSFEKGIIMTNSLKTGEQILLFNQFAYLIFQSLSIEANLDIKYYG